MSTHPFGMFISRVQGNFKKKAVKRIRLNLSLESGNVWGTPIKTYIPNDKNIRNIIRDVPWHQAQYLFDEDTLSAKSYELQIDGIIKGFRGNIEIKLHKEHELNVGLRLFMLTKGKFPGSIFTGDEFIEFFHKNIGGGDDPFDRGVFGYNKALIKYTDRNGNELKIHNGDFFIGGFETSYYFYPESMINKSRNLHFNFGFHAGTNVSKYNSSIDLGITGNGIKTYSFNDKSNFQIGLSLGMLRKNAVSLRRNNIEFGTNNFIANLESAIEYNFISKKGTIHSFGANFYVQSSFNKIDERSYMIPIRHPEAHNSWGHGVTNLYEYNDYWSFLYSFTKKNTLTIYLQQDFTVSNNPDIQTGISYSFQL
ncbi:MAG: hypothetical protein HKO81_06165 [Flavobacteriaceae bacterium]|nr:hypothetical protein [Flavobacteriaceae bacterium]